MVEVWYGRECGAQLRVPLYRFAALFLGLVKLTHLFQGASEVAVVDGLTLFDLGCALQTRENFFELECFSVGLDCLAILAACLVEDAEIVMKAAQHPSVLRIPLRIGDEGFEVVRRLLIHASGLRVSPRSL